MILYRSASMLHSHRLSSTPKLFFQLNYPLSCISGFSPSFSFLNISRHRRDSSFNNVRYYAASSTAASSDVAKAQIKGSDTFFAGDSVSWKSLGLSDQLSEALCKSGLERPSLIQASCIPSILSGKDVIIAAETGCGKTHGYLAPVIDRLRIALVDSGDGKAEENSSRRNNASLILCPNVLLCEQVVRMADSLLDNDGNPLVRVEAVCGGQGWPIKQPDIIVSTPAALLNNIDPKKKRRLDFIRCIKFVVFDEADMLLCGSFENQVIRLLNMMRFDEKQLSRDSNLRVEEPEEAAFDATADFDLENEEDNVCNGTSYEEDTSENLDERVAETCSPSSGRKDWKRVRNSYKRSKQYIFVAATLPENGKKTAGSVLRRMFPDASWASGNFLHRHSPRLKHRWIEVSIDTQVDALIEVVNNARRPDGFNDNARIIRTMVFANTVDAVEAIANILQRAGIECHRYHKKHSLEERTSILADFRERGGILVCTDAAARGVDIPNVSHVIQADFATSAIDFLHRIGRTGRAGQNGFVTNLYTESNRDLVDAILQAENLGEPVETAFSRKRSFRNKLKKRGSPRNGRGVNAGLVEV